MRLLTRKKVAFFLRGKTLLCVIALCFICACATKIPVVIQKDIEVIRHPLQVSEDEKSVSILKAIEERNRTIEDDPSWIKNSYTGLNIRSLRTIAEKEYSEYKKYLDNGTVYIIVHPAYYPFFQHKKFADEDGEFSKGNVVERLLSIPAQNLIFSVLQAQERRMRDFLEYKSTEEKLIIIILPRNYQKYSGYIYKSGPDEYTRYLNEVTNESESVFYLDSRTSTRGYLKEDDTIKLVEFLAAINAKKVLIGGGYVGRCLEDFYVDFSETYGTDSLYMVPELSDISPKELNGHLAVSLLKPDGTIDILTATENLKSNIYGAQDIRPNVMNLQ
ncbi:MAG: hypothetical protein HY805_07435 [Nitrospirae bacterium]|nr:hypothetical protein [Nitrospirota bacterium]